MSSGRMALFGRLLMSGAWLVLAASVLWSAQGPARSRAAAVPWPPSSGLLVSEVQTGGPSASDEFIELYNAGPAVDLIDHELVYVTASGATSVVKAAWTTSTVLAPGQHLLLVNAAGAYHAFGDLTYTGGLAADGGSIVLRRSTEDPVDALSWGSAASAVVEGDPAPVPPSGTSLERLPGGVLGNGQDTNDNALDFLIRDVPSPESLAAPPILLPTSTPTSSDEPPASSTVPPSTSSSISPSAVPSGAPTPVATPTATTTPVPTLSPNPTGTPPLTPSPDPVDPIRAIRDLPDGSVVRVEGVVTAEAGAILGDRTLVIQQESAGITLRLPSGIAPSSLSRGDIVEARGALARPYGNLELRPSAATDVLLRRTGPVPAPAVLTSDALDEMTEGRLGRLTGSLRSIDRATSGSVTLMLADSSGEARVFVHGPVGFDASTIRTGDRLQVDGIVGQRASAVGRLDGYRLWPRTPSDILIVERPSPTARPSPSPRPTATPRPTPSPTRTAPPTKATPRPSQAPARLSIDRALRVVGEPVTVDGIVTAAGGLIDGDGRRVPIQDDQAAILLRLPAGAVAPSVGARVRASGAIGTYYGAPQLEAVAPIQVLSARVALTPERITAAPLVVRHESRLVELSGTVISVSRNGDAWRAEVRLPNGGEVPITVGARSQIPSDGVAVDRPIRVIGIVRRAYPTASDQRFAVAPRTAADLALGTTTSSPGASPGASAGIDASPGSPGASGSIPPGATAGDEGLAIDVSLDALEAHLGALVRVGGRIIELESHRIVIEDGKAAIELIVPGDGLEMDARPEAHPEEAHRADHPGPPLATHQEVAQLAIGEVVNATGRVIRSPQGALQIEVAEAADIVRVGIVDPRTSQPSSPPASAVPAPASSSSEPNPDASGGPVVAAIGLSLIALLLVVTWVLVRRPDLRTRLVKAIRSGAAEIRA